jgi:hypothetical protein
MFDGISYLKNMAMANKLAKDNQFLVAECSGLQAIEPMMDNYQTSSNFIMIDDTVDGEMVSNKVSWFNRRIYTVSIIARHQYDDMEDRQKKLDLCREIYRQMLTRLICDREDYERGDDLIYMRTSIIRYREMNTYAMDGATGVTFSLPVDEPTDLEYNKEEWADG